FEEGKALGSPLDELTNLTGGTYEQLGDDSYATGDVTGDFSVSVSVLTGQVARRLTLFDSGVKDSAIVIMNAVIANCGPACGASGDTDSGTVAFELPATLLGMNDLDDEYFLLDLEEG